MKKRVRVKPGKSASMLGMGVGVVFCLIGIFVAIPALGAFGIFWTLMAVIITVSHGVNVFSEKGLSTHEIIVEDEPDSGYCEGDGYLSERAGFANRTEHTGCEGQTEQVEERLRVLKHLYEEGLITEEEYEKQRKAVIERI
ncbi:MAG: SHOCT domain-containing protein [Lachnospiraceae bacterium]|nr:SHOCT domain-containing protein [Lachnospiraceae bacterium]